MKNQEVAMIVAMTHNGAIGYKGHLPWEKELEGGSIPEDMRFFRNTTLNHSVIMGRKTYESIGGLLDQRQNYILTRNKHFIPNATVLRDPVIPASSGGKVFIIGGAEVYKAYQNKINTIYLTTVKKTFPGDTFIPFDIASLGWRVEKYEDVKSKTGIDLNFKVLRKPF